MRFLIVWAFLIAATTREAGGDAFVRDGLFNRTGPARIAILLLGPSCCSVTAPCSISRHSHSSAWSVSMSRPCSASQVISFIAFGSIPNLPILVGGALIVIGGLMVSFWEPRTKTRGCFLAGEPELHQPGRHQHAGTQFGESNAAKGRKSRIKSREKFIAEIGSTGRTRQAGLSYQWRNYTENISRISSL